MTGEHPHIVLARNLFQAWSSGDADEPARYLAPDCVLHDIVGGTHRGWPQIRHFFAEGLTQWPDLKLVPERFWLAQDSVALTWLMTATVHNDSFGPAAKGKVWRSPGMSYLVIRDGRVAEEVDYHDRGAVPASLGLSA